MVESSVVMGQVSVVMGQVSVDIYMFVDIYLCVGQYVRARPCVTLPPSPIHPNLINPLATRLHGTRAVKACEYRDIFLIHILRKYIMECRSFLWEYAARLRTTYVGSPSAWDRVLGWGRFRPFIRMRKLRFPEVRKQLCVELNQFGNSTSDGSFSPSLRISGPIA
jgi:hypothetical protein